MCGVGDLENLSDCDIPGPVESLNISGVNIPETATIETSTVDLDQLDKNRWISKVKLLSQ